MQNTVKPFAIELIAPIAPAIDKIGNKCKKGKPYEKDASRTPPDIF